MISTHQWQLEIGGQYERRRPDADVRTTTTFVPTLLRFGLSPQLEARVETNSVTSIHVSGAGRPEMRSTGYSPVSVGMKYQIFDSGGDGRRSLGLIARLIPPTGSAGFHNDRTTGDVRLAADCDFAPHLSLNPNFGFGIEQADDGHTFAAGLGALTLNYLPTERLNPFIDAGTQAPEAPGGRASVIVDAGVAYIIGHDVQLDVSAGRGIHGSTPPEPFIGIGISVRK